MSNLVKILGLGSLIPGIKKKKLNTTERRICSIERRANFLNERIETDSLGNGVFLARRPEDDFPVLNSEEVLFPWKKQEKFPKVDLDAIITHYGLIVPRFEDEEIPSSYVFQFFPNNVQETIDELDSMSSKLAKKGIGHTSERPNYTRNTDLSIRTKNIEIQRQYTKVPISTLTHNWWTNSLGNNSDFKNNILTFDEALAIGFLVRNSNAVNNKISNQNYLRLGLPRYLVGRVPISSLETTHFGYVDLETGEYETRASIKIEAGLCRVLSRDYKS